MSIVHLLVSARCHNGPTFSDGKFYRLGTTFTDKGCGAITGDKRAFFAFRTPGLRDVARTVPYLYDGSLATLTQVVEFYYRGVPTGSADGLPLDVTRLLGQSYSEVSAIVAFLESLNGEQPQVSMPALPCPLCFNSLLKCEILPHTCWHSSWRSSRKIQCLIHHMEDEILFLNAVKQVRTGPTRIDSDILAAMGFTNLGHT